ncbi:hypothetical protein CYMTET_12231 [Cymbomonas tetramitiformis]|uniref:Uncharacterized protein n=1 Tax=Cymbomonas tetramitiformis TaxID=36881 RepID=A0AAE0GKT8_9CHLO|nr:hypothetical protein CYMTET_12231 [Cymbomonas tetramitiformis]
MGGSDVAQTEERLVQVTTDVEHVTSAQQVENRHQDVAQGKEAAARAKRKAVYDAGQECFLQLKSLRVGKRVAYVRKLKVEPLKGLLVCFNDNDDELPKGNKPEHLASVLSFVGKMEATSAPIVTEDVEMHGVQSNETASSTSVQPQTAADGEVSEVDHGMQELDEQDITLSEEEEKSLVLSFLKQFDIS